MKTNQQETPEIIFDWINTSPFDGLETHQQKQVLEYFTADEYNEMHEAAVLMAPAVKPVEPARKAEIKKNLLEKFDAKHHKPVIVALWKKPVALWKAAAILVIALTGWTFIYSSGKKHVQPDSLMARVDTVYVTKEVKTEPTKVHDTIYVVREGKQQKKNIEIVAQPVGITITPEPGIGQTGTVTITSLENIPNIPRGNSMKDDTLLKKYGFVTL